MWFQRAQACMARTVCRLVTLYFARKGFGMASVENMRIVGPAADSGEKLEDTWGRIAPEHLDALPPYSEVNPMPRRRRPEVLAPAGNLATLKSAIDYGADAVYCAGKMFGMRSAPKNFSNEDLQEAVKYAHDRGARIFITCNILPTNPEIEGIQEYIGTLSEIGVDAVIVSDIGVLMAAKRIAPNLEIHVSTQAGVVNHLAANSLYELGAKRVVLARELSLDAVRAIRKNTPADLDIECFVHGSMCMAFSGRCLISQYMTGRDANHGDCSQSCRWKYSVVEEKRPGQFYPIEQTEHGAYLFNAQDMNMLEHIDDLIDAGATSLKIEGRAKSGFYSASVANAYKTATNMYVAAREAGDEGHIELPEWLKDEVNKVTHREYCTGFYYPEHPANQNTHKGGYVRDWQVVGTVTNWSEGRVTFKAKNKIVPGQIVEFVRPGQQPYVLTVSEDIRDEFGHRVDAANNPTKEFSLECPQELREGIVMRSALEARPAQLMKTEQSSEK